MDAYEESEQLIGFFTMIEEHLALPFETKVLGVVVTVEQIDLTETGEVVAKCRRGRDRIRMRPARDERGPHSLGALIRQLFDVGVAFHAHAQSGVR